MSLDPSKLPPPPPRRSAQKRALKLELPPRSKTEGLHAAKNTQEDLKSAAKLEALRQELELLREELEEREAHLLEREAYVEQCENELVMRSLKLTEREAYVEQLEEGDEAGAA